MNNKPREVITLRRLSDRLFLDNRPIWEAIYLDNLSLPMLDLEAAAARDYLNRVTIARYDRQTKDRLRSKASSDID